MFENQEDEYLDSLDTLKGSIKSDAITVKEFYSKTYRLDDKTINTILKVLDRSKVQKDIIYLYCLGYSKAEIGRLLGLKKQNIQNHIKKARNKVFRVLGTKCPDLTED